MYNHIHMQATLYNKKFERLSDFLKVYFTKFLQKIIIFQIFLHILNRLDELIWKMVLFFVLSWIVQIVNKQLTQKNMSKAVYYTSFDSLLV